MFKRISYMALVVAVVVLAVGKARALEPPHDASNSIGCNNCHAFHSGALIPREAAQETMCKTCHNPTGQASGKSDVSNHPVNGGLTIIDCGSCHDAHSPDTTTDTHSGGVTAVNLSLIRGNTTKYVAGALEPVLFQQRPAHFAFGEANQPWNGVCQTCHTGTAHHTNDVTADHIHEIGLTCTDCHSHAGGFAPASCVDCHSQGQPQPPAPVQYRRQVTGTGGNFERFSHHVTDGTTTEIVTDEDCQVCHDQSSHKSNLDPSVLLNDPDGGASHTYDGAGASIESFCLNCHDALGPTTNPPFSDGLMPTDINTDWTTASHNTALTAEACLSCHGGYDSTRTETDTDHNAHGAASPSLLSPLVAGETVSNPEEALCFACHDADGPSLEDVETRFGPGIRWVTAIAGENDNLNLNDRHDIQDAAQSTSGAKVECTDCHDPHADYRDTGVFPLKSDPDPTDGRTPGTGQILSGADFMTEWCLDCHDGSFPSTVTPPSTPLKDVRYGFQNEDSHGIPTGNPTLKSGYGWAQGDLVPCLACHNRHHVSAKTNLFQLVDLVKSKDGATDIPSDNVNFNYEVTDNNIKNAAINGYEWCNTCHTGSMGDKKDNCFDCHYHGARF